MFKMGVKRSLKESATSMPTAAAMSEFSRFFSTGAGDRLLDHQREELRKIMPAVVGYNCLQFSIAKGINLCESNSIGHYVKVGYAPGYSAEEDDDCWVDMRDLPIASDCIDIAILHHMLDFSSSPHQVLREVDRTLTEGGYLILVSFQPRSTWSIAKRYWAAKHWINSRVVKRCKPVSISRMNDWLRLLNYDVHHQQANYFVSSRLDRFLSRSSNRFVGASLQKLFSPLGVYSIVVARKRRSLVNPLIKPWKVPSRRRKSAMANTRINRTKIRPDKSNRDAADSA